MSAILVYVNKVMSKYSAPIKSRGFNVYQADTYYNKIEDVPTHPESLKKLIQNTLQCGPKKVIE
mgnify:CR=1 FL=1